MKILPQGTGATIVLGPFVDSLDGVTPKTTLVIAQADIRLSKLGAAFAQTAGAAGGTHMENGYYSIPLTSDDIDTLGRLFVAINMAGALPVWREYVVVPTNTYNSLVAGSDWLQADMQQVSGGNPGTQFISWLGDYFRDIEGLVAADAGNSPTTFLTNFDAGIKVFKGMLRITSGALDGESCLAELSGSPNAQVTVLSESSMPAALKQFSATPADGVVWSLSPF